MEEPHESVNENSNQVEANASGELGAPTKTAEKIEKPRSRGKLVAKILAVIIVVVGAGAAYYLLVAVPNKPVNVFKKSLSNLYNQPGSYTITGRLDQASASDPDFTYRILTNASGDQLTELSFENYAISPSIFLSSVGGKKLIQFDNFLGKTELAKKYTNLGKPGLAEAVARFADSSTIATKNATWFEIPSYFSPSASGGPSAATTSPTTNLTPTIGAKETLKGISTQKFSLAVSKADFLQFVSHLDKSRAAYGAFKTYADNNGANNGMPVTLDVDIWVNLKTKTVQQISYIGRPFSDATFSLKLEAAANTVSMPSSIHSINDLGYGLVSDQIFNKSFQTTGSDADRERAADFQGIKTALEMYKSINGHFPDRYQIAVGQADFVGKNMPGVSLDLFRDPNGRFIGKNGSQYAYVPQSADGNEACQNNTCTKFFIATTQDNGKQLQLNSN